MKGTARSREYVPMLAYVVRINSKSAVLCPLRDDLPGGIHQQLSECLLEKFIVGFDLFKLSMPASDFGMPLVFHTPVSLADMPSDKRVEYWGNQVIAYVKRWKLQELIRDGHQIQLLEPIRDEADT